MKKYPKSIDELEQEIYTDFIRMVPAPVSDSLPANYSDLDEWIRNQWSELEDENLIKQLSEYLVSLRGAIRDNIEERGHKAYMEYMSSREWQKLRDKCLDRDDYKCCHCGNTATQAHHAGGYDFDRTPEEELALLKSICWVCHAKHEQIERLETKGKNTFYRRERE